MVFSSIVTRNRLEKQIGEEFQVTVNGLKNVMAEFMVNFLNQAYVLSMSNDIQMMVAERNQTYTGTPGEIKNKLLDLDRQWINADDNDPHVTSVITRDVNMNRATADIIKFTLNYPEQIELFITDKYGGLLAASRRTTDYYQADEDWWIKAWNNGRGSLYISQPEYDESVGENVLRIAFPIFSDDNIPIGIMRSTMTVQNLARLINSVKTGESGHAHMITGTGQYVLNTKSCDRDDVAGDSFQMPDEDKSSKTGYNIGLHAAREDILYAYCKLNADFITNISTRLMDLFHEAIEKLDWYIIFVQNTNESFSVVKNINRVILIISLIILVIIVTTISLFIQRTLKPLDIIIEKGYRISMGDYAMEISESINKDEIGKLQNMFRTLLRSDKDMAEVAKHIAEGDLRQEVTPRSIKDELGNSFRIMIRFLRDQANNIMESVNTLTSSNSQIMSSLTQLASSTNETATTVSEISTTIEEVKQTAEVSTQKAQNVADNAQKSVNISEKGINATEDSIEGMQDIQEQVKLIAETIVKLSDQSQAIGEITSSVNDIAEQSNLLAVNASIEAVKAGDYGKGFGVVAQEIRVLADQSKQATKQIRDILNDVQKAISSAVMATEQGSKAVDKGMELTSAAGDAISMLADSISESAESATQIAASSQQQLKGMEQLAVAMENIKMAAEQNAQGTKESEVTVQSLKTIVDDLKELVKKYKL